MENSTFLFGDVIHDQPLIKATSRINIWVRSIVVFWAIAHFIALQFLVNILPLFFHREINALWFWRITAFLDKSSVDFIGIAMVVLYLWIFNRDVLKIAFFGFPILKTAKGRQIALVVICALALTEVFALFGSYTSLNQGLSLVFPENMVEEYIESIKAIGSSVGFWGIAVVAPLVEEFIYRFILFYFFLTLLLDTRFGAKIFKIRTQLVVTDINVGICVASLVNIFAFSLAHGYCVLYVLLMIPASLLFVILPRVFGSVTASIIYHAISNTIIKIKFL